MRGGRNQLRLMVIVFLSIPGCLAYGVFEILPDYAGRRSVRAVRQAAARAIDPERDLRRAREALDIADIDAKAPGVDRPQAQARHGLFRGAPAGPRPGADRGAAAVGLGRRGGAPPGAEAQCRHAALLIAEGRRAEALPLRMDRSERARDAGMCEWAAEQRAEWRQSGA